MTLKSVPVDELLKQKKKFFNSVKTLRVSIPRPIDSLMNGTQKTKFSFYFPGLKLDLNFCV